MQPAVPAMSAAAAVPAVPAMLCLLCMQIWCAICCCACCMCLTLATAACTCSFCPVCCACCASKACSACCAFKACSASRPSHFLWRSSQPCRLPRPVRGLLLPHSLFTFFQSHARHLAQHLFECLTHLPAMRPFRDLQVSWQQRKLQSRSSMRSRRRSLRLRFRPWTA